MLIKKLATRKLICNDVVNSHMPIVKIRVKRKCLSPWMKKRDDTSYARTDHFKSREKSNILARLM